MNPRPVGPRDPAAPAPSASDLADRVATLESRMGGNMDITGLRVACSTDVHFRVGEEQTVQSPDGTQLIQSDIVDALLFRLTLPPGPRTGLKAVSQVMIDKVVSVSRGAIAEEIGECDPQELEGLDRALGRWLDLG